ncbi:hypothetical protein COO09_16345 [Rhizorhabdus dicambivorans]|uniref:SGNH hydrolase-type esterase domain-containing protein n=2 Tax=Rhizorhabdus dicambivorans TaxID=1850238 RepID=A0A2A4FR65_9SPHN|nr:hypothetical protein COO09_16345 [Rhizorhabdus dicambivorans]
MNMASQRRPAGPAVWVVLTALLALAGWFALRVGGELPTGIEAEVPTVTLSHAAGGGTPGPYLADIPGKPRAGVYFEGRRLVAGYAGPAARYRRSCDGAVLDAGFAPGSDTLDLIALEAWRTRAPCNIYARLSLVQVYDQDGRQPPLAAMGAAAESRTDPTRAWQGRLGSLHSGAQGAEVAFAGDGNAFSALLAVQLMASVERVALWSLADARGGGAALTTGGGTGPAYRSGNAVDTRWLRDPAVAIRANPTVIGWTGSAEARSFFARGQVATRQGRFPSAATERFRVGVGGPAPVASWARYGVVLWKAPLTPSEMQAAIAQVNRAMAFPTHFDAMAVAVGDSILYGAGAEGTDQRGPGWFLSRALPTVELFNLGMKAQQLAQQVGPSFGETVTPLLKSSPYGASRTAILWQSGTNDIGLGGRGAAELLADSAQAVRLSRGALPGLRVLRATLLPRADGGWMADGAKEATRLAVNAAWRRDRGAADLLVDLGDPASVLGSPVAPRDTTAHAAPDMPDRNILYVDRLHPSGVGYASGYWQAMARALQAQLGQ